MKRDETRQAVVQQKLCRLCDACVAVCPHTAISIVESELIVDLKRCQGCGDCVLLCPAGALSLR